MSNNSGNNSSGNFGMIWLVVVFIVFALGSCSSSGGSSSKSYAEQYGYSVNDFYNKGSNGLWYERYESAPSLYGAFSIDY